MSVKEPTVISLFTGAMGLDLGFEQAGFNICVAVDKDKYAIATLKANRPQIPVIHEDLSGMSTSQILKKAGLEVGDATVLTAATPCEPFSTIGKRMSVVDKRASLIHGFVQIIQEAQPLYWVFENVPGLLRAARRHISFYKRTAPGYSEKSDERLGSAWEDILTSFEQTSYRIHYALLNAADYGVAQKRKRLIVIGSREGKSVEFPAPTHAEPTSPLVNAGVLRPWETVGDALYEFNDPYPQWREFPSWGRFLSLVPEGGDWRDLPARLQKKAIGNAYESSGGRTGFLRKLSRAKPSPTLVDSPTTRAACLCHPILNRPLTVGEYLRLQGFPINWTVEGPLSIKYRLIGQATPPPLAFSIAQAIMESHRARLLVTNTTAKNLKYAVPSIC